MAKRKGIKRSKKDTDITEFVDALDEAGEGHDMTINVSVRHYVHLDVIGTDIELNSWEAIKLGKALVEAGRRLGGTR